MLEALLGDLSGMPEIELLTSRDVRLTPTSACVEAIQVTPDQDVWGIWEECMHQADAFWPIAPESGGTLSRLSDMAVRHNKTLLSSSPLAVRHAASKLGTNTALTSSGISAVPTFRSGEFALAGAGPWVSKPDDGIGCEDCRLFHDARVMRSWLTEGNRLQSHIVQPYISGIPASISMLCKDGQAWLLSCNRQLVDLDDDQFSYRGSELNGMRAHWNAFEAIAQAVAKAMPGLAGYVGVDVVVGKEETLVLEVNPRLTTSYAGLSRATGCNTARMIVDLFYNGGFLPPPVIERNIVEIRLNE